MNVSGVSGRESSVCDNVEKEISSYADEIERDKLGNLIAVQRGDGTGRKIMFCAHLDEIGFFVTHIEKNGNIKVSAIGGVNPVASAFSEVVSENGVVGILVPNGKGDRPKLDDMHIEIGKRSKKEVERRVKVGDFFVCAPKLKRLSGSVYMGRPFDDRIGCAILIEAMKLSYNQKKKNDVYFVFSTQEEVGLRGSRPASYTVSPDIGVSVDVTGASDGIEMGKGFTIKHKDASAISSPELIKEVKALIENEKKIEYQNEVAQYGGTDSGSMQISGKGAHVMGIGIPSKNIHTGVELINIKDAEGATKLVALMAEKL